MKKSQRGVGEIKQRVRTVRAVPQITLGRNQTKNGPKKSCPGEEAYIKNGKRLGDGGSARGKGCGRCTFYKSNEASCPTGTLKIKAAKSAKQAEK